MNEFINSLDISIKDPYYGMEVKPDYIPYSDEASKFWNDQVCCLLPFELNLYRYKENNKKGYVFATKPCACYDVIPNTYKIVTDDLNKLLLFDKLKEVKEKILNDDYSLCKNCPEYQSYKNKTTKFEPGIRLYELYGFYGRKIYEGHLNKRYNSVMDNPLTLKLSLDSKCNLSCPTCREKDYDSYIPELTAEDFDDIVKLIKKSYIIDVGCDGETFLNKSYMDILKQDLFTNDSKLNKIHILTNGILANNTNFSKINPNNIPHINEIKVSIDAATESTYNIVRPGGRWNTLLKNINYLATHPQRNFLLHSTFTISKYNYKEVSDFVDFSLNLGFNRVLFSFARPIFHQGKNGSDFILEENHKKDIIDYLKTVMEQYNKENCVVDLI
jgi:molybdenum cofactor biosynthesis enzyme MoaA